MSKVNTKKPSRDINQNIVKIQPIPVRAPTPQLPDTLGIILRIPYNFE